ncbi:MAG: 4-oxalomesaconate tautomerase [Proteobacteria bacterium]|nr:4-oxalomesaconate tautomerase [Pseudomonadota bacterium]
MPSLRVPCVLMRGGTSRGPFFLANDLPRRTDERDAFLLAAMGSGHELQIDGIGGGNSLTSKVAIVGPASVAGADVDYLFAQVKVTEAVVDTSPNCGNMLAGVGPFAIEAGLVRAERGTTLVRIHNVNTGKLIEARVATPNGYVTYDGDVAIDGVPGTAAAVELAFLNAAGSKTGKLLPTGAAVETIDGIEVTCIDAATPLVIVRARDFGKSGHERPDELDADRAFLRRLEAVRIAAGERMGLRNVASLVIPKPVLVSEPARGGTICARYFVPHSCHKALAVTGAVGLATACATPGTIAQQLAGGLSRPASVRIEHPSGALDVRLEAQDGSNETVAFVVRTARRLFDGFVYAPVAALQDEYKTRSSAELMAV